LRTCLLITTWNRTPQLKRTLVDLAKRWTVPEEILVVDDGGDDGCREMCEEASSVLPLRYIYTHNPGLALCSHARNVGIKNTNADLLLISEPECKFLTDVFPQTVSRFSQLHGTQVISAGIVYHAQTADMATPEQCNKIEGWVAPYTALYPRQALLDVGGWNEFDLPGPWGFDDIDLLTRLRIYGINQFIDREIEVMHQWHVNPGRDDVGALVNDAWWKEQRLDERFVTDPSVIVANKGREWGVIKNA
jgi:glycosyltransferase involved in cell wall biosynthesis